MRSKIIYWIIWSVFILYTFLFAPNDSLSKKSTSLYIKQLIFGPFNDIDAYIITLFYFMGIWPIIYLTILLIDGQHQKLNGTLAALLSNFLGAWIILPYFALRRSEKSNKFQSNIFIRIVESKITTILLIISTLSLLIFGLIFGEFSVFIHEFQTNWFIHTMTIDFLVLSCLFPFLIKDDLQQRQIFDENQWLSYFRLCFIPLIGPLIYFYQRQPLKQRKTVS